MALKVYFSGRTQLRGKGFFALVWPLFWRQLAGGKLAARSGRRLGDAIILTGTYFPGEYRFGFSAMGVP